MKRTNMKSIRYYLFWFTASFAVVGCSKPVPHFDTSELRLKSIERKTGWEEEGGLPVEIRQTVSDALLAMFGTPNEPYFVSDPEAGTADFVDEDRLVRAAGAVTGDRYLDAQSTQLHAEGLYRQHCVHCHGVTGNGMGPTAAFLNPYPRDFTKGQFKFISTIKGVPPTDDDLHRILMTGIEGTSMPSFALLDEGERLALIDYVKYLTVRGQMERTLLEEAADLEEVDTSAENLVGDKLAYIVSQWEGASPVEPPAPSVPMFAADRSSWSEDEVLELEASIDRGRDLYFTAEANCYSCHGPLQLGDGNLGAYDDWSKELHDWSTTRDESALAEHLALGGLEPRVARPRNLRLGQYRGGRRPIDLYWRIHNGIDGSPMPNATLKPEGVPDAKGLTEDDIWDLVNYVLALPYERLSRPDIDVPTNKRQRS